jgi:hypothetical protein
MVGERVVFRQAGPVSGVATRVAKPPPPRPRGQRPKDIRAALQSLFTNLPLDELPPARLAVERDDAAPPGAPEAPADDPAQLSLFTPGSRERADKNGERAERKRPAPATAKREEPSSEASAPGAGPKAGKSSAAKSLPHPACADELYPKAVAAARERGSASLVHLKRALDIGYSRASALIDAMVADGILGEVTASGSRPTLDR